MAEPSDGSRMVTESDSQSIVTPSRNIRKQTYNLLAHLCTNSLEDVEPVPSGRNNHARNLRVPMTLLDIPLPLMNKQQLRWHSHHPSLRIDDIPRSVGCGLVFVGFDGEIPHGDTVICGGGEEERSVVG